MSLRHGLVELSESYRKRLAQQGELDRTAEDILAKLRQIREEIAARVVLAAHTPADACVIRNKE